MWIPLHDNAKEHKKTWILAEILNTSNAHVVGLMACLWSWAVSHTDRGDLSGYPNKAIAKAAGWEGDPEVFVAALLSSGFLDEGPQLHDWEDHMGRLVDKQESMRENARLRKQQQRERERRNRAVSDVTAPNDEGQVGVPRDTGTSHNNVTEDASSCHTPIKYSQNRETINGENTTSPSPNGKRRSISEPLLFERFYNAYPRKAARIEAVKAFKKLNPDENLLDTMLSALIVQGQSDQWTKEGGTFIPLPATWLLGRRWEDEPPKQVNTSAKAKKVIEQQYSQRKYDQAKYCGPSADLIEEAKKM